MTTKNILTLIGVLMGLQAIGLFVGSEAISTKAFEALEPDATGIAIGALMHEVLATLNLLVAFVLLACRNLEPAAGAKVLMGVSSGLVVVLGHGFYNFFATETQPPLPLLVLMTVLMTLGFITANKAKEA